MNYIFKIFHRLNTGGKKLKNQEISNCIYSGPLNALLRDLGQIRHGDILIARTFWLSQTKSAAARQVHYLLEFCPTGLSGVYTACRILSY